MGYAISWLAVKGKSPEVLKNELGLYQVTTSALTNRSHLSPVASQFITMDAVQMLPIVGLVRKLWDEITDPNVLCITTSSGRTVLHLSVCALEGSAAVDQELVLD